MANKDASYYRRYAREAAVRYGLDPNIFERQIDEESHFNPAARSGAGAVGIAQIVPRYHPGVDPTDPKASLDYAAQLMASHLRRYGGKWATALSAYNAGPGAVEQYGGVPPFAETQKYVKDILGGGGSGGGQRDDSTPEDDPGQLGIGAPLEMWLDFRNPTKDGSPTVLYEDPKRQLLPEGKHFPWEKDADPLVKHVLQHTLQNGDIVNIYDDKTTQVVNIDAARAREWANSRKPTYLGGQSSNEPWVTTRDPSGKETKSKNANYQPPTKQLADGSWVEYDPYAPTPTWKPATGLPSGGSKNLIGPNGESMSTEEYNALTTRMNTAADAKYRELNALIQIGQLDDAQAGREYDRWWKENLEEPQRRLETAVSLATYGQNAGDRAVKNAMDLLPYTAAGPTFNEDVTKNVAAIQSGGKVEWRPESFQFPLPDVQAISAAATEQALAGLSALPNRFLGAPPPRPAGPPPIDWMSILRRYLGPTPPAPVAAPPRGVADMAPGISTDQAIWG